MRNRSREVTVIVLTLGLVVVRTSTSAPAQQGFGRAVLVNSTESDPASLPELVPCHPIERELKGGEMHSYRVRLEAGQFMQVVVEQKGIDVIVALADPIGMPIAKMHTPNEDRRPERVSLIAEASGNYRVHVRSEYKQAQPGPYEIRITELRQASLKDRDRVSAERAFSEAVTLHAQGTKEGFTAALDRYARALALYRSAGDRIGEASTLAYTGEVYASLGENEKALAGC